MTPEQLAKMCADPDEAYEYLPMWEHTPSEEQARARAVVEAAGLSPMVGPDTTHAHLTSADGALTVEVNTMYWRKANAIHAWFVDTCQGGVDECQEAPVEGEQLAHLRSLCQTALTAYNAGDHDKARETLTPRVGFFFGGYDIDQYYAEDLANTIAEIERVITAAIAIGSVTFVYQSSW